MKIKNFRLFFFGALFAIALSIRAAIPPAENLLPEDTLFLVTVPDFTKLREAMHHSSQWLLWNDPAMKPFHDHFMAKWNENLIAPLEQDLGVKFADFENLPQGQLTFAVTQNGWSGDGEKKPGFLLLLDAKDKSDLLKTNLAAFQKKWSKMGRPIRTENVRGIKFSIVPLSSNDIPASLANIFRRQPVQELGKETKPAKPGELVIGQFESLLIVGNSIEAVAPVAAHLTGGALPALAENAIFTDDKTARFRNAPLYYGWFNAKTVFNVLAQIPPAEPNPEAPSPVPQIPWDKVLSASGLTGLKSASFSYRESPDGSQADFFLSAPDTSRAGLFKIFALAQKDANPPAFVPADAVKFWRWRVDGQKSWAALQTVLADISPAILSSLNSVIDIANMTAQQKDPTFDVRKNLIANLGDDWISYQKSPAGTTLADLNNAPSLFLFAATNPEQALLAVKSVASLMSGRQSTPEPRDFLGKKIYAIPLPAPRGANAAAIPPRALYCATSGGYVAMTKNSSILENYLRSAGNPPNPLRETAGLADAAQHVGGAGNGLFGYENQHELMRTAFTAFKNSSGDTGRNLLGAFPKILGDWMDFSLLPDYDQVAKYFYFSVYAGDATADGISFQVFAPRPPRLN